LNKNSKVLMSKDGEELDGFQEVDEAEAEPLYAPVKPTVRCKRCGCWLRAPREEKSRRKDDEPFPQREYCSACEAHMLRHAKPCALCGETFFSDDVEAQRCPECEAEYQRDKKICASCGNEFLPYVCVACRDKPRIDTVCHSCHWRETHAEAAAAHERICRVCGCRFLPRTCIVPECGAKLTDICNVCHEEIEHMNMTATVWTLPDCPKCEAVLDELKRRHRKITRLSLEKLARGDEPDVDAMAHLAMSGGAAPLVFVDGRFLEPEEIDALIAPKELA
jgi:hypothetical protein